MYPLEGGDTRTQNFRGSKNNIHLGIVQKDIPCFLMMLHCVSLGAYGNYQLGLTPSDHLENGQLLAQFPYKLMKCSFGGLTGIAR